MTGRRRSRDGAAPSSRRERRVLDAKAARLAAGDLLSRRAWTMAELTRRLVRRGAPPEVAAAVVDDLAGRGYVDDAAFARHFVETRAARGYGTARLAADLRGRGVAPALITAALADLDGGAQLERARSLARRRLAALTSAASTRGTAAARTRGAAVSRRSGARDGTSTSRDDSGSSRGRSGASARDRTAGRLRDYLLRRGFSASVVLRVVREMTGRTAGEADQPAGE